MDIFKKIHSTLTPKEEIIVFKGGETIDRKMAEHLKKYNKAKVAKLFAGDKIYELQIDCTFCKFKSLLLELTKTKLVDFIFAKQFKCVFCVAEENNKSRELYEKRKENSELQTDLFINDFLNPECSFNDDVLKKNYFNIVVKNMLGLNSEKIFGYAAKMPYYDFLKTPYWAAVRYKVMQKSDFKCSLCNKNGKLAVHHRSYQNRGYEIQTQKDLICLCNDCHEKFHDIK